MLVRSPRPEGASRTRGDYAIAWIEQHCVYTIGRWAGRPVTLQEWQREFIRQLLAVDDETGRRRYRWALLGVPKKNGKTELAAWLALYFLIGDGEPTAWVACVASADHQADLVFGAAKRCAEWSSTLRQIVVPYDRHLEVPSLPGARLVRVTAGTGTNDGPSWHAIIFDELHELTGHKGEDLHTVMSNGIGGREEPIILQITTAGVDVEGTVCGQQYQYGKAVAADVTLDLRYLMWWYEPGDLDADYRDVAVWREVNPSWGVTLPDPEAYLSDQMNKKREAVFRRYFLNMWVPSEDVWLPYGAWDLCAFPQYELDPTLPLYVGIDGGLKRDSFAIAAYQLQDVSNDDPWRDHVIAGYHELKVEPPAVIRRAVTRGWVWQNPYPPGDERRSRWKLNLQEPANVLRDLRMRFQEVAAREDTGYRIEGPVFGYDPMMLEIWADTLRDEGLNLVEFPQTDARMCPASELLYQDVMTRRLTHDGDPYVRQHVYNAVAKEKERSWRLARPAGSRLPNDAVIATAMAALLGNQVTEIEDDAPAIY